MKDFQQRKKFRRMIASRIVFIVLIVVTVFLVRGSYGVLLKERETSRDLAKAKQSLAEADARRQELTASIDILKTPQGLEKEIRDRFRVAKIGEEIVLIVDPKTEEEPAQENTSVWQRVGGWIKNIF